MNFSFAHHLMGRRNSSAAPDPSGGSEEGGTDSGAEAGADVKPPVGAQTPTPEANTDAVQQARQGERARWGAIFAAPEAEGRVALAAQLAFTTDLSAEQVIGVLKVSPSASVQPSGNPFSAAMGGIPNPQIGLDAGGAGADDPQAIIAQILKAGV
jgi:hypothetical protein